MEAAYKRFHYWFDVSQERAQQWFMSHTRWFTVIFAIIFAFWLQLDTVEIFRLVSSNRAVRDALVAQSGIVTKQTEKLLGDSQSVLQQALASWRSGLTDDNARKAVEAEVATPTDTRGSLREKVQKKLVAAGIPGTDGLLATLDSAIDKTVQESLKNSGQQFSDVKLDLDKTGFALFPANGKGRWGDNWGDHFGGTPNGYALANFNGRFQKGSTASKAWCCVRARRAKARRLQLYRRFSSTKEVGLLKWRHARF